MTNRRNNATISNDVTVVESIPMEIEDSTVEEYQKLNEKIDDVMSKIKSRKSKKERKNK